jgi:hypothetical protein
MKIIYECDICGCTYDNAEEANQCQSKHTLIYPTWFCYIPFMAWIYIPYKFITSKNAIVIFDEINPDSNWSDLKYMWMLTNPVLIIMLLTFLKII